MAQPDFQDQQEFQFQNKRRFLSKEQQIYGVFTEAYDQKPSFSNHNKSNLKNTKNQFMNFKAGEKINTNKQQVQVNIPKQKKKKKVTFAEESVVHVFQKQKQQVNDKPKIGMFSLDSFLNSRLQFADQQQQQLQNSASQEQQQQKPIKPTILQDNIKKHLKLIKFSEFQKKKQMADYGLPSSFGGKSGKNLGKQKKIELPKKTRQEIQKESSFKQHYGIGFNMMAKMGFKINEGLGKDGLGIKAPVEAVQKNAFVARDQQQEYKPVVIEEQQEQQTIETRKIQKGVKQLFEYFSEDQKINKLLNLLKNQYEILEVSIMNQEEALQKLQDQISLAQSNTLINEQQNVKIRKSLNELSQLKENIFRNCDKHPHHALKFNIDLLIVKLTIDTVQQKIKSIESFQDNKDQIFNQIHSTHKKLQKIYLAKQRQTIGNFSKQSHLMNLRYESVIDVQKLEQKAVISEEDLNKIKKLMRLIFQQTILKVLKPSLKTLKIQEDAGHQFLISILKLISSIDKELIEQILVEYVYPSIEQYLNQIQIKQKIPPHLLVFSWFQIINPLKINFKVFLARLYQIQWNPESTQMLDLIKPWKIYFNKDNWIDLINFAISPKLFYMMQQFNIFANEQNDQNLTKLKSFIKYSQILPEENICIILENSLLIKLQNTYKKLKKTESKQNLMIWLKNWKKTLSKMRNYPIERIQRFLLTVDS